MLEVRDLSVSYGKHRALENAALRVNRGEIVVILGANGAGKTTLLKAICGISEGKVGGSVVMEGAELTGRTPDRIVEEGLALVPEGRGIFGDLSVQENLLLGAHARRARDDEAQNLDRVLTLFPKLAERRRQVVRTMSGGEQQMVAIGRAMMSNPSILALDEPSLGLSPLLCKELFQSLLAVRSTGLGILLVEQNAKQSLAIADRGYLLENGSIVHEDDAKALASDPAVQKAYLGGGSGGAAKPAAQARPPVAPRDRPAAGPKPSDIAAAALRGVAAPVPRPAPPVPAPQPTSQPQPAPKPAALDLNDLVAQAAARSSRKQARPALNGQAPQVAPPAPRTPAPVQVPMPDLQSSADRLKSALAEIEAAARRAENYRPARNSQPPRR